MNSTLVKEINLAVMVAMTPLMDKYPDLSAVLDKSKNPSSDFDFFMTVAGVGSYFLKNEVSSDASNEILKQLSELDKQMPEGLNNFFSFMKGYKNDAGNIRAWIGFWVLWDIAGAPPGISESRELAPAIGNYLFEVMEELES
jgi:hypothetical protein